jgi:hypothetical protein
LFIQPFRGYAVNPRKIDIEHHLLVANGKNSDVLRFVFHPADGSILSFSPARSSRRYQLLFGEPPDASRRGDCFPGDPSNQRNPWSSRKMLGLVRDRPTRCGELAGSDARR